MPVRADVRLERETDKDAAAIRAVHLAAFPTAAEANLVDTLRQASDAEISLVARDGPAVVGHVMLSRMRVEGDGRTFRALGLGPVAVAPGRQRQGIGTALIDEALERARQVGEEFVFVVGEPGYYRRFGFAVETAEPFASPYSGAYFMAKSFGVSPPSSGAAAYASAFEGL